MNNLSIKFIWFVLEHSSGLARLPQENFKKKTKNNKTTKNNWRYNGTHYLWIQCPLAINKIMIFVSIFQKYEDVCKMMLFNVKWSLLKPVKLNS